MNESANIRLKNYQAIRATLKTGDIALYAGNDLGSKIIRWACKSEWSHVALVIHIPKWDLLLQLESNTSNQLLDVDEGHGSHGVQLNSLSQAVQEYKGRVAFRKLDQPLSEEQIEQLIAFRTQVSGWPYETDLLLLITAPFMKFWNLFRDNNKSLFCSELVAEAYQKIGLLPCGDKSRPDDTFVPGDFSSEDRPTKIKLLENALGLEELV